MAYVDEGTPDQSALIDPLTATPQEQGDFRSALADSPAADLAKTLRDSAPLVRSVLDQIAPEPPPMDPKTESRLRVSMIFGALAGQRPSETAAGQILSRDNYRREQARVQRSSIAKQLIVEQLKGVGAGLRQRAGDSAKAALEADKQQGKMTQLETLEQGRNRRLTQRLGARPPTQVEILAGLTTPEQKKAYMGSMLDLARAKAQASVGASEDRESGRAFYRVRTMEADDLLDQSLKVQNRLTDLDALIKEGKTRYADPVTFEPRDAIQEQAQLAKFLSDITSRRMKIQEEIEKGPAGKGGGGGKATPKPQGGIPEMLQSNALVSALQKEKQNLPASAYTPEEARALLAHRKALRAGQ